MHTTLVPFFDRVGAIPGTAEELNILLQPLVMGYPSFQMEICGLGVLALSVFARTRKKSLLLLAARTSATHGLLLP